MCSLYLGYKPNGDKTVVFLMLIYCMCSVSLHFAIPPKVGASIQMIMMVKNKDGSILKFDHSGDEVESTYGEHYSFLYEQCNGERLKVEEELNSLLAFKLEYADHPSFPELLPFVDKAVKKLSQEMSGLRKIVRTSPVIDRSTYTGDGGEVMFYQAEYGSPHSMPSVINLTVLSVKNLVVTESTQKRWRYLSHLPLGHSFNLIEVDLRPPVISNVTIDCFIAELEKRRLSRSRVLLEDLRLTELKEAAENRIPSLRDGFRLSGHAELSDLPNPTSSTVDSADFVALCPPTSSNLLPCTSVSFAEVTKCGARSVVDHNRIANFSRIPRNRSNSNTFDLAAENWPSLGEVKASTGEISSSACFSSPPSSTSAPRFDAKTKPHDCCEEHVVKPRHRSKRKQHNR